MNDFKELENKVNELKLDNEKLKNQLSQIVALVESVVNQVKNSDKTIHNHEMEIVKANVKLEMLTNLVISRN